MASIARVALVDFCRLLPAVSEDIKWGNDLVFSVGNKMFAAFPANGKDASFGCKVPEDEFGVLTSIDGIKPAAYAARFHWVSVDDGALPMEEAIKLVRGSYDLVKTGLSKKLQKQIDEALPPGKKASAATKAAAPPKAAAATKKPAKKAALPAKKTGVPKKRAT